MIFENYSGFPRLEAFIDPLLSSAFFSLFFSSPLNLKSSSEAKCIQTYYLSKPHTCPKLFLLRESDLSRECASPSSANPETKGITGGGETRRREAPGPSHARAGSHRDLLNTLCPFRGARETRHS